MEDKDKNVREKLNEIKAVDLMSRFAITTTKEKNLIEVAHLMIRFKISGLPVVSREGKVVGIITATDLFRVMGEMVQGESRYSMNEKKQGILVKDVMTKDVLTVEEQTTLYEMITLMHTRNIHTLPLLKHGKLIGVVGRRDVLYKYYSVLGQM